LTYDTMTEQVSYNVTNVSHGIADGLGGDSSSAMKNDLVATSTMSAMVVILAGITTGTTIPTRQTFNGGMTVLSGGLT